MSHRRRLLELDTSGPQLETEVCSTGGENSHEGDSKEYYMTDMYILSMRSILHISTYLSFVLLLPLLVVLPMCYFAFLRTDAFLILTSFAVPMN